MQKKEIQCRLFLRRRKLEQRRFGDCLLGTAVKYKKMGPFSTVIKKPGTGFKKASSTRRIIMKHFLCSSSTWIQQFLSFCLLHSQIKGIRFQPASQPLKTSRYPYKGSSWVFSNWVWHKVGRTHLALQNAWVYSKLGRSKCFSNYLNFRAKNISKYKLLHSRVDPTQKVYRSRFDVGRFMPGS